MIYICIYIYVYIYIYECNFFFVIYDCVGYVRRNEIIMDWHVGQ